MDKSKYDITYMPPKMYAFLVRFGEEYNLSVKEVLNTILRHGMEALGFKCEHLDIRAAKNTGKPYCFNCWTRMRLIKAGTFSADRKMITAPIYEELPTFMDDEELWLNLHMKEGITSKQPIFPVKGQKHYDDYKRQKNSDII